MSFKVKVSDLTPAVLVLSDFVPLKDSTGAFTAIRITTGQDYIQLSYSNSLCAISLKIPAIVTTPYDVSIQFDSLYKTARSFSPITSEGIGTESLVLDSTERGLSLKATSVYKGKKSYHRRLLPVSDSFVPIPEQNKGAPSVDVQADVFSSVIRSVLVSSSSQEKGMESMVLLGAEEDKFYCVSTNRVTLTEARGTNDISIDKSFSCVLDSPIVAKIIRMLVKLRDTEYDTVSLFFDPNYFALSFGGVFFKAAASSADFPPYKTLFEGFKTNFTIDTLVLSSNINNLSFNTTKGDDFRISLGLRSGQLSVTVNENENIGIDVEGFLGDFSIDFNCFILEPIISNMSCKKVKVWFKDGQSPIYVEPVDGDLSLKSLVAPLG